MCGMNTVHCICHLLLITLYQFEWIKNTHQISKTQFQMCLWNTEVSGGEKAHPGVGIPNEEACSKAE